MKSNVNVFIGVVLCAVLCGTFVWLRSAGEEDTWKPNEIYDQVHSSSYSASYTNATFSGSPQDGGVALSMSSSSLSRKANFYAGAHSGVATMPLASSPMGAASGAGLYTTSSAELKSFGGGGNGGAAMGGAARGNSVSNPSPQGGVGLGFSPISYTSARRSEVGGTSGTNPSMIAQQGMTPDMASASNFGYAAATSYLNGSTYDQSYTETYGTSRKGVSGRKNSSNVWDSWYDWFHSWWGAQGGANGNVYVTKDDLYNAWLAYCEEWSSTMGGGYPVSYEEWEECFIENSGYGYGGNSYFWAPVGDIFPLILLALLYIVVMFGRTKFRTQTNG